MYIKREVQALVLCAVMTVTMGATVVPVCPPTFAPLTHPDYASLPQVHPWELPALRTVKGCVL